MKSYVYLGIAIVAEVFATTELKASAGFSRPVPTVLMVLGYAIAFYFLSLTLQHMSTGIAYAIWSGIGIVLISLASWAIYGQSLDTPALIGIGLIMAGVIVVNVFSSQTGH